MNKKYKLLKNFPGNNEKIGDFVHFHSGTYPEYFGDSGKRYLAKDVENYPEFWQEVKEPLFTTFDRVDINKGDVYWYVVENSSIYLKGWTALSHQCDWSIQNKPPLGYVQFSTKEAAEKYIKENKPKYSEKDMIRFGKYITSIFDREYIVVEGFLENWELKNKK